MFERSSLALLAALAILCYPYPASTQENTPLFELEPVVTSAEEEAAPPDDSSVFITNIDVEGERARSKSVSELLESSVGLNVKSYGGLGSYSVAMIRGASPNQITIYLDGVPLNSAKNGVVNLGDLPLANLQRIEVYRGFAPPALASSSIGGAINLITKKGRKPGTAAEAKYGSFNTYSANASYHHPGEAASFLFHADAGHSDGDYPYLNDHGTRHNTGDDTWDQRENNDYDYENVLARVEKEWAGWSAALFNDFYTKRNGLPGIGANQSENARYEVTRNTLCLSLERKPKAAPYALAFKAYHGLTDEAFKDKKGEIGIGNQDNESFSRKLGADVKLTLAGALADQYIILYASVFEDSFEEKNNLSDGRTDPRRIRRALTLSAYDEFYIGRLTVSPSLRYERYDNDFSGEAFFDHTGRTASYGSASPKLGVSYKPTSWLELKANAGRYFRAPDMTELFGDRGVVVGNSDLEPETGTNLDAGFKARLSGWMNGYVEATVFMTESDNLIAFVQNSQRTSMAQNIGKAKVLGAEFSTALTPVEDLKLSLNYTWQEARDESDIPYYNGNTLPNRPKDDLFARVEKSWGAWRAFYEVNHTGLVYLDRANFNQVSARSIHNFGLSLPLPIKGGRMTVEAKNMTDDRVADAIGYPLPGRSFFISIEWKSDT